MAKVRRWEIIKELIPQYDIKSIVEIGVLKGENASNILEAFPDMQYIGVDPYMPAIDNVNYEHEKNKQKAQAIFDRYPNAQLKIGVSTDFEWTESYDLVFIDGDHSYEGCNADIIFWKTRYNKIIAGHDYSNGAFKGVRKAVDENFSQIIQKPDHVWIHVK